jgi:hypothetical protein
MADVQDMIRALRSLGTTAQEAAPECAKALEADIRASVAAGKGPDGTPWQRTKDGKQPLQRAADAVTVVAKGTTVIVKVVGIEARHHWGTVKGGIIRRIIPTAALPQSAERALAKVLQDRIAKKLALGGG